MLRRRVILLAAALLCLSPIRAEVTPMSAYLVLPRTDVAMAGTGGIGAPGALGGGEGTLMLAGVSGTVNRALLYWHGIDYESPTDGFSGGDADYDQANIVFDGVPLVGTRVAQRGDNNGWPSPPGPDSAALYRAEVTSQVQARGNGSYAFSGLAAGAGHSPTGVSLIVYFDDGVSSNDFRVVHYEGLHGSLDAPWQLAFDLDYGGGPVDLWMHVADGQSVLSDGTLNFRFQPGIPGSASEAPLRFNSPLYDGLAMWAGASVPDQGHPRTSGGPRLWDIRRFPLTGRLGPPGRYRVTTDYETGVEAVSLLVAQLVQPADPADTLLSPNPFDFGDVLVGNDSAVQRFTLRNLMPHPIRIDGAPTVGNTPFRIVAETCSGQTLAADARCTIDVVCTPGSFAVYHARSLRVSWAASPAGLVNTTYAPLACAGVPAGAFSRLDIAPYTFDFGEVIVASQSPPQAFVFANTGSLPLSLDAVGVDGSHPANFPIQSNDCGTRTLQPGEQCTVVLAFNAPATVTTTRTAELYALFSASDDPSDAVAAVLRGKGVADPSRIFRDGFD